MPWFLVALHAAEEPPVELAADGPTSVGRRPTNSVVCKDLAVSGQHCLIHGPLWGVGDEPPEVEDCSTNGTYVNEVKLTRGQRQRLVHGDVISLTKPLEDSASPAAPRVQFRIECRSEPSDAPAAPDFAELAHVPADLPPTAPERTAPTPASPPDAPPLASNGRCGSFAQKLLVQEQQSKAKITSELLASQRKLAEERQKAEAAAQELRKVRQEADEERTRRREAEEVRDRLSAETDALRADRRQLQELQTTHDELRQRHEGSDAELRSRAARCSQLEAAQEELRVSIRRATEEHRQASQRHSELLARSRAAVERADRLEQLVAEARREAARGAEETERLRRDLAQEVSARRALEEEVERIKTEVAEAEAIEREAREARDSATARRASLECEAARAQSDVDNARGSGRQAQQRLLGSIALAERLRESGRKLSVELRRRADLWEQAIAERKWSLLDDLGFGADAPTFAQATCRAEAESPAKQADDGGALAAAPRTPPTAAVDVEAEPSEARTPEVRTPEARTPELRPAAARESEAGVGHDILLEVVGDKAPAAGAAPVNAKLEAEASRSLVTPAAAARATTALTPHAAALVREANTAANAATAAPDTALDAASGGGRAVGGCSTAWSLEVLDFSEAPASKRFRAN
mmetsp:Transcript_100999/g.290583  ORF Transcript_100999/g.290583 Transcript_100999/m.290583 type:complete len:644 (-) Transcript_100999:249-2180(-)